jgi:hypothetical protein
LRFLTSLNPEQGDRIILTWIRERFMMHDPPRHDRRQHPRIRVEWSVIVKAGTNQYLGRSVNVSTHGAKVRTSARLKLGAAVQLDFVPPDGPPLRVQALVWRVDPDGMAFLFSWGIRHPLIADVKESSSR